MRAPSHVIVITGHSATGKTTIGRQIAARLGLPFFSKDTVKELFFEHVGYEDRAYSKRVGFASYRIMYHVAEQLLQNGTSFVLESNFKPKLDDAVFAELRRKYSPAFTQLLFWAEGKVLLERFRARSFSDERHPGHIDAASVEAFAPALLTGRCEPLDLGCPIIEVDTTDFSRVDVDAIVRAIHLR